MKSGVALVGQLLATLIVSTLLVACGNGSNDSPEQGNTPSAPVANVPPTQADPAEKEAAASPVALTLELPQGSLQDQTAATKFSAAGGTLASDPSRYTAYVNDKLVAANALSVNGGTLSINGALTEGRNSVLIFAPDGSGAPIEYDSIVWAGTSRVAGRVVDDSGNPVAGAAVTASLGDDSSVIAKTITDSAGNYLLQNFPSRTVVVNVVSPAGTPGTTSGAAGGTFPDVVLRAFSAAVATPNNEFLSGTSGWLNRNNANVELVDHIDNPGPDLTPPSTASLLFKWLPLGNAFAQAAPATKDLRVRTNGEGPRTVTYTFKPSATTKSARIRYRFQTDEYPQYFGSEYNDSFQITLRTASGKSTSINGAMNELGSTAFGAGGSTAWKELTVELGSDGEDVQVDLTVANVGDGVVDSSVIVDFVSTSPLSIASAKVYDVDNSDLRFLSAAEHTYFGGNTRVHAQFKVTGSQIAKLSLVELQVLQSGAIQARGKLTAGLESAIYTTLGTNGREIAGPQLAFEVPSAQLASISRGSDGLLALKLVARTDDGSTAEKDLGTVKLLDRWTGTSRYGGRDEGRGGDDWVTPSARDVIKLAAEMWGDFSNMNAGSFAPDHSSHKAGKDADGWFDGYNARNAATATKMIQLLNTPGVGSKVKIVYVTHSASDGNAFYDAYKNVTLADGRPAKAVIKDYPGHTTHFHWNVQ